jgi:hypothetical protein
MPTALDGKWCRASLTSDRAAAGTSCHGGGGGGGGGGWIRRRLPTAVNVAAAPAVTEVAMPLSSPSLLVTVRASGISPAPYGLRCLAFWSLSPTSQARCW